MEDGFIAYVSKGIEFARQPRFLLRQMAFFIAIFVVAAGAILLFAWKILANGFSGGILNAIRGALAGLVALVLFLCLLALAALVVQEWLKLFFVNAAKMFFEKREKNWKAESAKLASSRLLSLLGAAIIAAFIAVCGSLFFSLLGALSPLHPLFSLLGTIYGILAGMAFLYIPAMVGIGGKGTVQAIEKSYEFAAKKPLDTFLLLLSLQIISIASILLSLLAIVISVILAIALRSSPLLLLAAILVLCSLLLLVAAASFSSLVAIGAITAAVIKWQNKRR